MDEIKKENRNESIIHGEIPDTKNNYIVYIVIVVLVFALVSIGLVLNFTTKENPEDESLVAFPTLPGEPVTEPIDPDAPSPTSSIPDLDTDESKLKIIGMLAEYIDFFVKEHNDTMPESLTQVALPAKFSYEPDLNRFVIKSVSYEQIEGYEYALCTNITSPVPTLPSSFFTRIKSPSTHLPGAICFGFQAYPKTIQGRIIQDKPVKGSTSFADTHIADITYDGIYTFNNYITRYTLNNRSDDAINTEPGYTKESGHMNFPYGFFSSDQSEWGAIVRAKEKPITATITFREPVKLLSIANLFSNCQIIDCYMWEAKGITDDNQTVSLVQPTVTGKDSTTYSLQNVTNSKKLQKLLITVTRTDTTYDTILVWKKIQLSYQ